MRLVLLVFAVAIAASIAPLDVRAGGGEIRFGLTAVVVRENVRFFDRWADYLQRRIGRPVRFVQRRSYAEISELLAANEVQVAWICGYPFVRARDPEYLDLLAVPVFRGSPLYRSYIIAHRDSSSRTIEDLAGSVFAFSDPDSNSGYLVPRAILARQGFDPDTFHRLSFFTYSHAETVAAVAEQVADAGAVESYVWEFLAMTRPDLTARTRVLFKSEQFGFPPIVARSDLGRPLSQRIRDALLGMAGDEEGRALLRELALDGFMPATSRLYDSIRDLARRHGDGVPPVGGPRAAMPAGGL